FFEAEDGIRDFHVTGVQTCALPISGMSSVIYEKLLNAIKVLVPTCNPQVIKMDFEKAFIAATSKCFPNAIISGCSFHFSQAVWRHIQSCPTLLERYTASPEYALS